MTTAHVAQLEGEIGLITRTLLFPEISTPLSLKPVVRPSELAEVLQLLLTSEIMNHGLKDRLW